MAITFGIIPGSIRSTANPPTYEATYVLAGVFDAFGAKILASSSVPVIVAVEEGLLFRQDLLVEEKGVGVWNITVPYSQNKREVGEFSFNFTTTGGTFHITHSRESVARYPTDAADMKQAIAVKTIAKKGFEVQGTDIIIPSLKLSYRFRHPQGVVNEAFARQIASATGRVNKYAFRGFDPGEVLFLGGEGADGTATDAEVTYHFACEKNLTGLIIGAITAIEKQGHDLIWVHWKETLAGALPAVAPKAVYVERLYERIDLAAALGWGA